MSKRDLADFLRRRREALHPDQVHGAHPVGGPGAPPGCAGKRWPRWPGVSTSNYERLEQARGPRPSPQVLAAVGTALRLTTTEREHLSRLAGQAPLSTNTDRAPVPDDARQLLHRLGPIPAHLVDEREDILAWNAAAAALITDFAQLPAEERNTLRLSIRLGTTLCSAAAGAEGEFARQSAAELRVTSARHLADRALGELVNEVAAHSPDFAAAWRSPRRAPPGRRCANACSIPSSASSSWSAVPCCCPVPTFGS